MDVQMIQILCFIPIVYVLSCCCSPPAIVEMQDVYGCVLFSEYTVGTILRDLAYVFAFEEGEVPPSPVVQPGTLRYGLLLEMVTWRSLLFAS